MSIHTRTFSIPVLAPIFGLALLAGVTTSAIAQSVDASATTDDSGADASVGVNTGGTSGSGSASVGGGGDTDASASVGTGDTTGTATLGSGSDGTAGNVTIGTGDTTGTATLGAGGNGAAGSVSIGTGSNTATGTAGAGTNGSANLNVSLQDANQIGSLSSMSRQDLSAALSALDSSAVAKLRTNCSAILASPGNYPNEAVIVCQVIVSL